jgi:hypothetical protein
VIGMVADAELATDDGRDPPGGPDLAAEAERLGPTGQQGRELRPLRGGQLRRRAGSEAATQGLGAPALGPAHPLADRAGGHTERFGDGLLGPALSLEVPGAEPPPFAPVDRSVVGDRFHASTIRTARTTFSPLRGDQ